MNKFIGKSEFPKSKHPLTILPAYDIVLYYNSVIRGLIHYYGPAIDKRYYLNYAIYLLTFSCYHTLAQKYRCSISKLLKKYGSPIRIFKKAKTNNKHEKSIEKSVEIIYKKDNVSAEFNKTDIRRQIVLQSLYQSPKAIDYILSNETIKDPFSFKFVNWRAGTILTAENCCICGAHESGSFIQMHHLKHIAKDKSSGFNQILKQVKRKQIPTCTECHKAIHDGTYDGMSLSDITFPHYLDMEIKEKK